MTPDMMTMAKALTNGAQPMGAVAICERIHDTIMGAAPEGAIEFFHGYTYSGHPAACAAGLATLDIYKSEGLFERGRELSPYFLDAIFLAEGRAGRRRHPRLRHDRARSMSIPTARRASAGTRFQKKLFDNGLQSQGDRRLRDHRAAADRREARTSTTSSDILRRTLKAL